MMMPSVSGRKPRCVAATATYLNAGLWGSRFIGDCEISTNGDRVWLKGSRVPVWVAWVRVISYVAFLPVGFYTGVVFGQTLVGHWGYPPYYYLASALLTFLLVVLGLWGADIWTDSLSSYEVVSWPASAALHSTTTSRGASQGDTVWGVMNTLVNFTGLTQVEIPIGRDGKPRRLVLKARDAEAHKVMLVLAGVCQTPAGREAAEPQGPDPWAWSRN
jgi:hypothetical protein